MAEPAQASGHGHTASRGSADRVSKRERESIIEHSGADSVVDQGVGKEVEKEGQTEVEGGVIEKEKEKGGPATAAAAPAASGLQSPEQIITVGELDILVHKPSTGQAAATAPESRQTAATRPQQAQQQAEQAQKLPVLPGIRADVAQQELIPPSSPSPGTVVGTGTNIGTAVGTAVATGNGHIITSGLPVSASLPDRVGASMPQAHHTSAPLLSLLPLAGIAQDPVVLLQVPMGAPASGTLPTIPHQRLFTAQQESQRLPSFACACFSASHSSSAAARCTSKACLHFIRSGRSIPG